MKRAFVVSVWFHLVMIVLVVVPTLHLMRRMLQPSVYQVRVVDLPPEPAPPAPIIPPRVEPPPKPKAVAKSKISPPIRHKAEAPLPPLKLKQQPPPEPAPKPEAPSQQPPVPTQPAQQGPVPPSPPLQVDAPEFDCGSYCVLLQRKLEGEWSPPSVSAQGSVQAVIGFTINRDGTVSNVAVDNSSNNFYFDQAALRAVQQAVPLPPLPHTLTSSTLRVHMTFTHTP